MADMGGMSADTSSYLKPSTQNPLDQILKTNEVLGQYEVGRGVQQAIQPDGSIDRNVLAQVLKGSIAGSMQAPQALSALEKLRHAGYAADTQGLQNFDTRMQHVGKAASYIMENPTKEGVMRGFGYLANPNNGAAKVGLGIPQITDAMKEYYDDKGNLKPPEQVKAIAQRQATQAAATQESIKMHLPGSEFRSTGQRDVLVPTGTAMNPAVGTKIQQEVSPTVTQPGANNQPTFRGYQPPSTGADYETPGQPRRQPDITKRILWPENPTSGGKSVNLAQPGDGTKFQGEPSFGERFGAAYGVPRGGAAAPVPGAVEAQKEVAGAAAQRANELTAAMNEAPQTKSVLNAMEEDLNKFASGPGADYSRIGKSFAIRNLPIPESMKKEGGFFDPASIASQEQFNKFAGLVAQSQFRALGGTGTDQKLNSASSTSPNEYLSKLGNKGIIQYLKGLQDAVTAKDQAWANWQASGKGADTFTAFSRDFNRNFDPRVFQFKYMTPSERDKTFKGMPDAERRQFAKDATRARLEGWVDYGSPK